MAKVANEEWWSFLDDSVSKFTIQDNNQFQMLNRAYQLYQEFQLGPELKNIQALCLNVNSQEKNLKQNQKVVLFSKFQEELEFILEDLGVNFQSEVEVADGLAIVDFVVYEKERMKLVIEVDGPSHFFRNLPRRPLRKTKIRNWILEGRQLDVLSISITGWRKMKQEGVTKRQFVQNQLLARGISIPFERLR
eukprot:TRINITY_DN7046_c0_g1_i3.p2 TRINITY_DN7046_c0_g1~~TRINITY_DN7046_c0_g1_i3.p2  ORF type:complete len:192 (+),score=27.54 TRINITY_DN7046_c0_g1_i3:302-877(+)